ncbi:MAG: hypothetical protein P4L67_04915 [Candidatus Pacebacteria bacterium]|nr:hypothetical protein [Candidatus Paceibacterota bacterium]
MNQIIRSFAAVVDDVKPAERSVVAKIGTRAVDRYKTVIEPRGIDLVAYRTNPVVLFEHGKDPLRGSLPIGRNQWVRVEKDNTERLLAKTIFGKDDFSAQLFDMYCDGTMRGWSVSILPKDASVPTREEIRSRPELANCDLVYRSSELLEYSVTAVPGNPEALSQQELRSIARLVVRGFWSPNEDVKPLVDPIIEQMNEPEEVRRTLTGVDPVERMNESTLADGGALVDDDEDEADEPDDDEDDETKKKKKKKRSADDDAGDDVEMCMKDEEKRSLDEEAVPVVKPEAVERTTPEPEPEATQAAVEPETIERTASAVETAIDEFIEAAKEVESVVDARPDLPPLVGRPLDDILKEALRSIDDFEKANTQRIQDLKGWFRGEA